MIVTSGEYKGFKVNNKHLNSIWLDKLLDLVDTALKYYNKPLGFHLRIRCKGDVSIGEITDRMMKFYNRKHKGRKKSNTFKPMYLIKKEFDASQDGSHYHLAFIIDGNKATPTSVRTMLAELYNHDLIYDYKPLEGKFGLYSGQIERSLKDVSQKLDYIDWLSYICKIETSVDGKACWFGGLNRRRLASAPKSCQHWTDFDDIVKWEAKY